MLRKFSSRSRRYWNTKQIKFHVSYSIQIALDNTEGVQYKWKNGTKERKRLSKGKRMFSVMFFRKTVEWQDRNIAQPVAQLYFKWQTKWTEKLKLVISSLALEQLLSCHLHTTSILSLIFSAIHYPNTVHVVLCKLSSAALWKK